MYDIAMAGAGGLAFGIIAIRAVRMGMRMTQEYRRKRLLDHLDWSVDEFGRRRRRA
jgi:hypothetical protein